MQKTFNASGKIVGCKMIRNLIESGTSQVRTLRCIHWKIHAPFSE